MIFTKITKGVKHDTDQSVKIKHCTYTIRPGTKDFENASYEKEYLQGYKIRRQSIDARKSQIFIMFIPWMSW